MKHNNLMSLGNSTQLTHNNAIITYLTSYYILYYIANY